MKTLRRLELDVMEQASNHYNLLDYENFCTVQEAVVQKSPIQIATNVYQKTDMQNSGFLQDAISNLDMITVDNTKIIDFFSKVNASDRLNEVPIATPIRDVTEIGQIRPRYLDAYLGEVEKTVDDILKGKITSKEELQNSQLSENEVLRYKKGLVRTKIPYDYNYKTLIRTDSKSTPIEINEISLTKQILPFLKTFPDVVKTMKDDVGELQKTMHEGFQKLQTYSATFNDASKNQSVTPGASRLAAYYLYSAGRTYLDLVNYTVFMMVRKINNYAFNVNVMIDLYNQLMNYFPEGEYIMHEYVLESVLDGSFRDIDDMDMVFQLLNGDASVLKSVANRLQEVYSNDLAIADGRTGMDQGHSDMDYRIDENDYDLNPYESIDNMLEAVRKSVNTLRDSLKDPYLSFDDVVQRSGLIDTLVSRFSSVTAGISDVSVYTDEIDNEETDFTNQEVLLTILNELRHFNENIDQIAKDTKEIYDNISSIELDVRSNTNGEFNAIPMDDELETFLHNLKVGFQDLILVVSQNFMTRLTNLDDAAKSIINGNKPSAEDPDLYDDNDYEKESVLESIEQNNFFYRESAKEKKEEILSRKFGSVFGLVMEAEGDNNQGGNNQNQNQGNNQNQNNNQQQNKNGTIEVTNQDQANQSAQDGNQNQNNNNQNQDGNKKFDVNELAKRIREFFNRILNKFRSSVDQQSARNLKWLEDNKEAIMNRKVRGIALNMYPYDKEMPGRLPEEIQKVTGAVKGMTKDKIDGMDNAAIVKELFPFINISADSSIEDKIVQWNTTGQNAMEVQKYENSAIEKEIPSMFEYCENYYGNFNKDVTNAIENLQKALETTIKNLGDAKAENVRYLNKVASYYAGAVLNAIRDRNYAYLKTLKALVPKNAKNNNTNQNDNQNQNNDQNQNQGGDNNQNQDNNQNG